MSHAHLLLLDNDPLNLDVLSGYFRSESGITVHTARTAQEAWMVLEQRNGLLDILVLDCLMFDYGSLDLILQIRADQRFAAIPIILQTPSAPSAEQMRNGASVGIYHYLTMPATRDATLSIIQAALSKSTFRTPLRQQSQCPSSHHTPLDACEFSIRTLEEADELAKVIAQACPNADTALLGISELLVNGVEHGNLGLSYEEKTRLALSDCWKSEVDRRSELPANLNKRVHLSFRREPEQITVRIADEGRGFAWQNYLELDPRRACDPNGRGIALARMLSFSSIHYEGCGNVAIATIASASN